MPLVQASVYSIIAVTSVNYYTVNSKATLLPLYYKVHELLSLKEIYGTGPSKVNFFLMHHLSPS